MYVSEHSSLEDVNSSSDNSSGNNKLSIALKLSCILINVLSFKDEQAISSTAAGPSAGPKRKGILTRPSLKTRSHADKQRGIHIFSSNQAILSQFHLLLLVPIGKNQKSSLAGRTAADPNRPYGCSKCGRNYKRKDHLTRHSAHECVGVVIPNQAFECSKCGRHYKRKDHLLRHSAHECVGVGPSFSCTKCDYRARRKHHLSRHLSRIHKIDHRSKK